MSIITFRKIYFNSCIFFLVIFAGIQSSSAQCPTVVNPNQSFCDLQSPTVASLVATNNGNGIVWYATATSTTPLSTSAGLVNGENYFADDNSGSCGTRQSVTVTIFSAPIGQNFQGVCVDIPSNATISDLIATGNNVQWYSTSTGGAPLSGSTVLMDNTIYYASQTNPNTGCETSRLSVFVNVGVVPVPTGDPIQEFCNDGTPPTIGDLVASGANNWYATISSASQLPLSTPLVNGQSYFATTVDPPCESLSRLEVTAVLLEPTNPGTNGIRRICAANVPTTPPFNLFNALGGTPDTTGTWSGPVPVTNGHLGTLNPSALTLAGSPYTFTYTVASSACAPSTSTVTVIILPMPTVSVAANTTICSGNSATVTFTGTPNATVTYTVNGGGNQTIVLNGAGTATITNTYTATTTFTLVSVASSGTPSCTQTQNGSITITVLPLPTATISTNTSICSGGTATVTFTGTPNATVTYTVNGGGNQTIVLNAAGTATITNTFTATTTFTLVSIVSAGSPACTRVLTGSMVINVIPLPSVAITNNATVCPNGSATVTFTGTPNATVTYNINGGGNQTIVLNAAGTASITTTYTATTTYNLVSVASAGTPSCVVPQTGSITITVLPLPTVAIAANSTICSGGSATVTFTGTPNATVNYTVNGGGNQTIVLNGAGTAIITNTYTTTTTFALVSVASAGTPSCTQPQTGSITITVIPPPTVIISSNVSICPNGSATVTFTGTPNASVTYNVNGGGNQTIVLNGSGVATITNTYSTTTTFNLVSIATGGTPTCVLPQTGTVTITVLPFPVVSIVANASICSGGSATVTFTGTPNATVTYTVNGGGNQTIVLNSSGTATITNTYTSTTTYNLVSVATSGTPSCSQIQTGSITITVLPLPVVAISSSATICSGGSATVTFTGTPNATVTYTINGGGNQTIVLNGSGTATITNTFTSTATYTLVSVATSGTPSCSQPQTGSVTITVLPLPVVSISTNTTICSGASATVTFTGTPNATVTYTVNGGGNQTIVLNGAGTATITNTYTTSTTFTLVSVATTGTPGCSQPQTGSIVITVVQLPVVAITSNATICPNGTATVTFTGTPNAIVTYTVNGGGNQTIVLNGSGIATITNTYTATATYTLVSISLAGTPACTQPQTGSIVITVLPLPVASISTNTVICSGQSATVTFTGTPNATVTYTVNGGPNQTIVLNGSGTATITNTYTANTVFTLVSVATSGSPGCSQPQTGSMTITVTPAPVVSIVANATICSGGSATVTFTGTPNATVTYTVNGGGNQTIVLNSSGTATITNTYTSTTTYNLVSVATSGTPSCSQPQTGSITITVLPLPVVAISSSATICSGGSATVTFTGTPNATVTYTINGGGNQTIVLNGSGTATITNTFTSTATYTLVSVATSGTPSCSQPQTGSITITVLPLPVVSISTNTTICTGASATVTFTGTPNATVTYTVNGGGNQTIVLNGAGTATITNTYTTSTTFTLVSVATTGTPGCSQPQTGSIVITVLQLPVVAITSDATICPNGTATITFTGTPNAIVTYTVNGGTNQTIVLNGSGIATITNTYSTSTTFTLVSVATTAAPTCTQLQTGSVVITVLPLPVVSISANTSICSGESATVTFTGTPNATVTYTVNGGANQTIVLNGSGTATITNTYTANTVFTLVSVATSGSPGCSQPQTGSMTIAVTPAPVVSISGNANVCPNGTATVNFTGTPNATVTYTVNGGSNQTIILNNAGVAGIITTYSTTTVYMLVSITSAGAPICTVPVSGTVTITVVPLPIAVISSNTTICSGSSATVTFSGTPNATVTYTVNGGGNQTIVLNNAGIAILANTFTATTTYTLVSVAVLGSPPCVQSLNSSITITVTPPPIAGNNAAFSLCGNGSPQDLFLLLGANAQTGGTWSPALASGTGIFNPASDPSGIYTYTVPGTAPCANATASVSVTVVPPANAGADSSANFCSNADPQDLFAILGGNPQTGGMWTPVLSSGTGIFTPGVDSAGTYTYTVTGNIPCSNDTSTVTITITPGPDAGISGTAAFCIDSSPQDLFLSLGGTPQVGGTWSPALASGTGVFNPAVDPAGVYTYTFSGNQPCEDDTATVTVTINPIPDAGTDGTAFFCSNYPASDLFLSLGGSPQTGGTWSPTLASGTGVFDPLVDAPGTYTYTVGGGLCSIDTAVVTVTVVASPNAGGAGATLLINSCTNISSVDLFTGLNGTQGPGTWADDDATGALTGNIFNPSQAGAGTYHFTYTVTGGITPCESDSATVTVIVSPVPNAGTFSGIQNICISIGTINLFTLLNGNQTGGDWTDSNNLVVNNIVDISTFAPGTYSYTYTVINPCGTDSETVQFTVQPIPALGNANIAASTPVCQNSVATITFSGMADGNYIITYNLTGSNILTNETINVTIAGGSGSFSIASADIPNLGSTTITFLTIADVSTTCVTVLSNVSFNFTVTPVANLEDSNLSIANICLGSGGTVIISNATGLADGNYQFSFTIPQANPATGATGIVAIAGGAGQFIIPSSYLITAGTFTFTINTITNFVAGCNNLNETATATFQVFPIPDVSGAQIMASASCLNISNEVFITGANNLSDGIYTINYQLSGASTVSGSATVTIASGAGSFFIPGGELTNAGNVTITIAQIISSAGLCGASGNTFNQVTFEVTELETPTIIASGNSFCADENPTIANLTANITPTGFQIVWYTASENGTAYSETDLLVNGTTYYASFSDSGCESGDRLEVTVNLSVCDIIIPDGFSPNQDNINDYFVIKGLIEVYPNFNLEIYNRYGNILYKGNKDTQNWDGTSSEGGINFGDKTVPAGVYFYIVEFNDGIRKPKQGRLYLSR